MSMNPIVPSPLSLENFSLTTKCTAQMIQLNNSLKQRLIGALTARIVGVALVIFASAADLAFHLTMAAAKSIVVLSLALAKAIVDLTLDSSQVNYPKDLLAKSPFIHLLIALDRCSKIFTLSISILRGPEHAHKIALTSFIDNLEPSYYKDQFIEAQKKNAEYQEQLQQLHDEINKKKEIEIEITPVPEELTPVLPSDENTENIKITVEDLPPAKIKPLSKKVQQFLEAFNLKLPLPRPSFLSSSDSDVEDDAPTDKVDEKIESGTNKDEVDEDLSDVASSDETLGVDTDSQLLNSPTSARKDSDADVAHNELRPSGSFNSTPTQGGGGQHVLPPYMHIKNTPPVNNEPKIDNATRTELNNKINEFDQRFDNLVFAAHIPAYCKFVNAMTQYFEEFKTNGTRPTDEYDYDSVGSAYADEAEQEIENHNTLEAAIQRQFLYDSLWKHIEDKRQQKKALEAAQRDSEQAVQPSLSTDASQKDETDPSKGQGLQTSDATQEVTEIDGASSETNKPSKSELLKSLTFINVELEAKNHIDDVNDIIRETDQDQKIKNFEAFLAKIKTLQNQLGQQKENSFVEPEDFALVAQIVEKINDEYIEGQNFKNYVPRSKIERAKRALLLINVATDAIKPSAKNTSTLLEGNKCSFKVFVDKVQSLKDKIQKDQVVDQHTLENYQGVVARFNRGEYLVTSN